MEIQSKEEALKELIRYRKYLEYSGADTKIELEVDEKIINLKKEIASK